MAPFAPETSVQTGTSILPKLLIVILGSSVIFLAIIIGFSFASKKGCPPRPSSTSDCRQFVPDSSGCQHTHLHHPPARRGLALPVASIPRCFACQNGYGTAAKASRFSHVPSRSLQAPSPYHSRRAAPTGVLPNTQSRSGRPASSGSPPATPITIPPSPRPGYGARGPTATLRPAADRARPDSAMQHPVHNFSESLRG
ncbi:hypothetical protein GSI_02879 [Ganoderma sinense ZZ0214-1]|uniref:Uncharacterized protein n=1 Tax=Ganoderma sinense ZZ0214-1 TaxID=1077348 RepID=A0A2G8SMV5_9APHY|nr:hypothetical protein GSI_02879 [Ganoderma sinense ZZ0214-1]